MFERLFGPDSRRKRALAKAPRGALHDYLSHPFPRQRARCRDVPIVSVDLETTGLDPRKDAILSVGLVEVRGMSIRLGTAWHEIIRIDRDIPADSAVIHQITDDHAATAGKPIEEVLPELLRRLEGKVMLVHFSRIEQLFIDAACRQLYGGPFVIPIIDTLKLGQRVFERRPRYNLPQYRAHNALNDALSTAELFLAMAAEMSGGDRCRLHDFITG